MFMFREDLRYALRQLIKNPGFALTAILSLALGIGATVSVYSVIYGVLMHPFPYKDADRMVNLSIRDVQGNIFDAYFTGPQLRELRNIKAFESIATWIRWDLTVTSQDVPEDVVAFYGIGETFPTLGVPPLLGRNLGPSDSPDGQEPQPVVMLHYRFWQRYFHGDPNVVGKTLELAHKKYTIIGVTRPHFTWGWGADVFLPQEIGTEHGGGVVARLRPGVSLVVANAQLQPLLERFALEKPSFPQRFKADIRPLTYETTRNMGHMLYLLFAAVAVLLAIGCGNVSILLLARATARQHEFAVRSAVGAGSLRIVRQLLTESLLLALIGTGLGIALAYRLLALIVTWMPAHMFPRDVAIGINMPVLLFSAGLALLTAISFGLAPALHMAKPQISQLMQSSAKNTTVSARGKRLHGALIVAQIAMTLVLLTATGAAIQGFLNLLRVPLGYDPHNVISVGIPVHENSYATWQERVNYFEHLRASIGELPEVLSTGISSNATPPYSGWERSFEFLGQPAQSPEAQTARIEFIDSGYFGTLHIPLLEGRIWNSAEVAHGALLVLVNQEFARRYYPDRDVLGRSLKVPSLRSTPPHLLAAPDANDWMQVIGVVGDTLDEGLDKPIKPAIFAPYSIQMWMNTQILARSRIAPESMLHRIRKQVTAIDPDQQTFGEVDDLETWIKHQPEWARGRLIAALFAGFSIIALVLSAVGLYSAASYLLIQRTNEFGIRMAVGAGRFQVVRIAMMSSVRTIGLGIGAGIGLSASLHRFISGWIGNAGHQLFITAGVSLLLLVVAAAACLVPLRRVLSVDPMTALRHE